MSTSVRRARAAALLSQLDHWQESGVLRRMLFISGVCSLAAAWECAEPTT